MEGDGKLICVVIPCKMNRSRTKYSTDSCVEDWTYESTIYYIEYTTHDYEFEYYGANRHILTCTTCGGTSGSPEYCIERSDTCIICGHYSGGIQIMSMDEENITPYA